MKKKQQEQSLLNKISNRIESVKYSENNKF